MVNRTGDESPSHVAAQVAAFTRNTQDKPATAADAELAPDSPVITIVERILTQALRDRASDVHIEPQDKQLRIRFRVDGALHDVRSLPAEMGPGLVSRLKILAGMNIVERRRPQDGQIATMIDSGTPVWVSMLRKCARSARYFALPCPIRAASTWLRR